MSVLAVITLKGDPERLVNEFEKMSEFNLAEEARGPISHSWTRVEDGMVIANWWDSEEGLRTFIDKLQLPPGSVETQAPEPEIQVVTVRDALRPQGETASRDAFHPFGSQGRQVQGMPHGDDGDDFDSVLKLFDGG